MSALTGSRTKTDSAKQRVHACITIDSSTEIYSQVEIRILLHIPTAPLVLSVFKGLLQQHPSQCWWCLEGLPSPRGEDLVLPSIHSATSQRATSPLEKKEKKSGEKSITFISTSCYVIAATQSHGRSNHHLLF